MSHDPPRAIGVGSVTISLPSFLEAQAAVTFDCSERFINLDGSSLSFFSPEHVPSLCVNDRGIATSQGP